jgi:hypothetical protein
MKNVLKPMVTWGTPIFRQSLSKHCAIHHLQLLPLQLLLLERLHG